jgi:hypothetical protein
MINRSPKSANSGSQQSSALSLSSNLNQLALQDIKPRKIIFFDANIDAADLFFALPQLNRLKEAGFELIGYITRTNVEQRHLIKAPPSLGIAVVTDEVHEEVIVPEVAANPDIIAMGVPIIPLSGEWPDKDTILEDTFVELFGTCLKQSGKPEDWSSVEGYFLSRHPESNEKFNLKKFNAHLGKHGVGTTTPTERSPRQLTTGGNVHFNRDEPADFIYSIMGSTSSKQVVLSNKAHKFIVSLEDANRPYKTLATTLNHIDRSLPKRLSLMLTDNKYMAQEPNKVNRMFLFTAAALLFVVTTVSSYMFLSFMVASCVTAGAALALIMTPRLLNSMYPSEIKNSNRESDSDSPGMEEEDGLDNDSAVSSGLYRQLRRARHDGIGVGVEEDEEKEAVIEIDRTAPGNTHGNLGKEEDGPDLTDSNLRRRMGGK